MNIAKQATTCLAATLPPSAFPSVHTCFIFPKPGIRYPSSLYNEAFVHHKRSLLYLNWIILFTHNTAFLFLKLDISQCAVKKSGGGKIWSWRLTLHFSSYQLNETLDSWTCNLWTSLLEEVQIPIRSEEIRTQKYKLYLKAKYKRIHKLLCLKKLHGFISLLDTNLFRISTNKVTGPLLPRVTLAICWAAFAIRRERFRHSKTLCSLQISHL